MSIIHDALKKVQQGLNIKNNDTPAGSDSPTPKQNSSAYIYEETPSAAVETLPQAGQQQPSNPKPPIKNIIKSILALVCAIAITVAAVLYLWKQVRSNMPRVRTFAQKSFDKLIQKKIIPDFKKRTPEELKALGQLTIDPSTPKNSTAAKPVPITLDIHGIMSNSTGNLVLINDQVYQEGDMIDGAKIIKIDLDSIKIVNNGIEQTIFVKN